MNKNLKRRLTSRKSFNPTSRLSETLNSNPLLRQTIGQRLSMALFLLLSIEVILGASAVHAQSQTLAYVANTFSNSVSVIDTASATVVATIAVGQAPAGTVVFVLAQKGFI